MSTRFRLLLLLLLQGGSLFGQDSQEVIRAVTKAQQAIERASYTAVRKDTLVTGTTRVLTGKVVLQAMRPDSVLGFLFWANQDGIEQELVYDGHEAYKLLSATKTYSSLTQPAQIRQLLNQAGGRLLIPDFVTLDTTKASSYSLAQDAGHYYLTIYYPDIPAYNVTHRCKVVSIARQTMLPMVVKRRQMTLGKVQCLVYEVHDLKLNREAAAYAFAAPAFIKEYKQVLTPTITTPPASRKANQPAPTFRLPTLDQHTVSLAELRGKVVLLDFWEAWCGPCVESMPKVQQLQDRYAAQGLQVYGINHEHKQLAVLKELLQSQGVTFATLLGTAESKQAYQLSAVPLYVLIDRQGIIRFRHEGFSPDLETAIQQAFHQ